MAAVLAIGLLAGCLGSKASESVPERPAAMHEQDKPTSEHLAHGYSLPSAVAATDTPSIGPVAMPQHVGQFVSVRGHVSWCQTTAGTHIYALNTEGTARFIVASTDVPTFDLTALRAFCLAGSVEGVVKQQGTIFLIRIQSHDQVTL